MQKQKILDSRLIGTWRSDAALTLAEWRFKSLSSRTALARSFGKLTMRYTNARVFTEFEGDRTVCSYRVAAIDQDSVAIVRRPDGKNEIQHIHFVDPDIYWVSVGGNREFFRRVER